MRRTMKKIIGRNSEIRTPKSETITENRIPNDRSRFEPSVIRNLNLFRISKFGFRISVPLFASRHDKDLLQVRQIHRRRHSRLAIKLAHLEALDHPDEQARRKNAA